MMSGNTWNQWLAFARALQFKVLEESSGIYMYGPLPDGTHYGKLYRRQRHLTGHLRNIAVSYVQLASVIRMDARYAFDSGDHSLIQHMVDGDRPPPSREARAAHRLHHTIAKRVQPARGPLDLRSAALVTTALIDKDQDEWYALIAGEELAEQSARQLEHELTHARQTGRRARL